MDTTALRDETEGWQGRFLVLAALLRIGSLLILWAAIMAGGAGRSHVCFFDVIACWICDRAAASFYGEVARERGRR